MSEPVPVYQCAETDAHAGTNMQSVGDLSRPPVTGTPDLLMLYFMRRRDMVIAELRELDRLLGRPQTIPVRER